MKGGDIRDELDTAISLQSAVDGDPSQGPYPATVGEVADEVVAWIEDMEPYARGIALAVRVRLGGTP